MMRQGCRSPIVWKRKCVASALLCAMPTMGFRSCRRLKGQCRKPLSYCNACATSLCNRPTVQTVQPKESHYKRKWLL
ncbi:Uncharacterised protein [Vibrio cholerae]|nr:Uncharacterised protein [Vibrio cholerae]